MMTEGWISLHRCIQSHWLWEEKPFTYGQAWVDLLLLVNHKDKKVLMDAALVTVPAGSVITSELKLADRWGWGRTRLRNFLKLLEADGMIEKKATNKQTTINVVNWEKYQIQQTADKQQTNSRQTTSKQQTNTNNNELIMINNVNKREGFTRPSIEEVRNYCLERKNNVDPEQFIDFYDSNGWKVGRNPMKDWKATVRNWEKREREEHKHVETEHERTLRLLREATE